LAISLVVALPLPLDINSTSVENKGSIPSSEDLSNLYSGEGWEFIDLEDRNDLDEAIDYDGEETDMDKDDDDDDDEGTQGIDRIREALETHTWPSLIRKDDRIARLGGSHVAMHDPSSSYNLEAATLDNEEAERALAALRLNLASVDDSSTAEPTKHDEELAQAFLKNILSSQLTDKATEPIPEKEESKPARSLDSMKEELERFLESQDTAWPLSSKNQAQAVEVDEETWQLDHDIKLSDNKAAFDDDFSDFVAGPTQGTSDKLESPLDSPSDEEMNFNLNDDIALIKALEGEQVIGSSGSRNPLNFESTLSVLMAQAERIRSIADHEKRREEAARVALALVREQP